MARYTLKKIEPPADDYIFDFGDDDTPLWKVQAVGRGILKDKGWRKAVVYDGVMPLGEIRPLSGAVEMQPGDKSAVDYVREQRR